MLKSPVLLQDLLASHQLDAYVELMYDITGAKTGKFVAIAPHALVGYDTGSPLDQASIDALLGSSNEFVAATAFGSTAMGTDALGIVLDMGGQVAFSSVGYACISGNLAGVAIAHPLVAMQTSALPNTLPTSIRCQVSAAGNLALQIVVSGLDAATSGRLVIGLGVKLK